MPDKAIIISDLHLGSDFCLHEEFKSFMKGLPPGPDLILNGDIVDGFQPPSGEDFRTIDLLREASQDRRIVWIRGNHDWTLQLQDKANIEFKEKHAIDDLILVQHGHHLEKRRFYAQWFVRSFRKLYDLHIRCGGQPVHVATYAKHFPVLYHFFRRRVMQQGAMEAKKKGFQAFACGHTHWIESHDLKGIQYLNTGSWTEEPIGYITVNSKGIQLKHV